MIRILQGDCRSVLDTLEAGSVHACICSPPYYSLRSYLDASHPDKALELGSEPTVAAYIATLVGVMRQVRRVLRGDGSLFCNLGDGHQSKSLMLIPYRVAIALSDDGWIVRSVFPWVKRSCLPESVTDRATNAVEYIIHAVQKPRYFWDSVGVQRSAIHSGRVVSYDGTQKNTGHENRTYFGAGGKRDVLVDSARNFRNTDLFFDSLAEPYGAITDHAGTLLAMDVNPEPLALPHYAAYPTKLVAPLIRAATSERGCCSACGKQWVRVTETERRPGSCAARNDGASLRGSGNRDRNDSEDGRTHPVRTSLGWSPACPCAAPVVPATVLDPFCGVATTMLAAHRLGRDGVGVDLSETYCALARRRIEDDAGMFAGIEDEAPAEQPAPHPDLFASLEAAE